MDVTLHLGAHRTATTSFQHYLRENEQALQLAGIAVWDPRRTRSGLLTGVMPVPGARSPEAQLKRARGRIAINLKQAEARGFRHVVISDENMIGAPRRNLRDGRLYADIGQRMARFAEAFDGRITRVSFSIRGQDSYWSSALAFAVGRGHRMPGTAELARLATAPRGWRDVLTDLACALPGVEIQVLPYEIFGGLPEARLQRMTQEAGLPRRYAREWMHRAPGLNQLRKILSDRGGDAARLPGGDGRWHPFDQDQACALREAYADDLFWLRAGADGLATLTEETKPAKAGTRPRAGLTKRGQGHGIEERRLA